MASKPECACGDTSALAGGKKRIVFPCAGQANTGQLTNLAAIQMTEEGYGTIACVALLAIGSEGLLTNTMKADEVVVLDGCPMHCAKKIAETHHVKVAQHIVITDLGIEKGPSKQYTEDDIETVVSATWEGKGRT